MHKIIPIFAAFMLTACQTDASPLPLSTSSVETSAATPTLPLTLTLTPMPAIASPSPVASETTASFDRLFQGVTRTASTVYVQDERAYVTIGPILVILNISDRQNPHPLGAVKLSVETISNLYISEKLAYVAADESGLRIVDISNPVQPLEVGDYHPPLMASMEKQMTWSGPDIPAFLYRRGARAVVVGQSAGQVYAYVAAQGAGLRVVNVTDPTQPVEVGVLGTNEGGFVDVAVANGRAYLAKPGQGVQIVDISDPAQPQAIRLVSLNWPNEIWSIALSPDQAAAPYVFGAAGTCVSADPGNCPGLLHAIDMATPTAPKTFASEHFYGYSTNIAVSGGHAYLLAMKGMYVLDISDPTHPQRLAYLPDYGGDIAVAGDTLYLANGNLQIFDLADPAAPALMSQWQPPIVRITNEPTVEPTPAPTIEPTP